jgi:hypothetical protein
MEQEKRKDLWDKLSALTPLILGILVTGVGAFFTNIYNFRQLQLNQIAALDKLRPLLTSDNPQEREFAYSSFVALGYEDTAIKIISIKKDQSGRAVLEQLRERGTPQVREDAGTALKVLNEAQKLVIRLAGDSHGLEPYYEKSKLLASGLGVTTQLGLAVIYDTAVHSGTGGVTKISEATTQVIGSDPKDGADEKQWIKEFMHQRGEYLKNIASRAHMPQVLSPGRMAELNKFIEKNDWELKTLEEKPPN